MKKTDKETLRTLAAIAHKLARAVVPREVVEKSLQAANQELREMGANPEFLKSEVDMIIDEAERKQARSADVVLKSVGLNIIPGLKELLSQIDLAFAAAESQPALREYVYWTSDKRTRLALTVQSDSTFLITVWDAAGEVSHQLDESTVVAPDGGVIAKILQANAHTTAAAFLNGFVIRDPSGNVLEVKLEN